METPRCNYEGGHVWRWVDDIPGGCWECATCHEHEGGSLEEGPPPPDDDTWMGLAELARATGLQHDQLRRAANDGRLRAHKWLGRWVSSIGDVKAALECGSLQRHVGRPPRPE